MTGPETLPGANPSSRSPDWAERPWSERLDWLRRQPDGTLFVEPAGRLITVVSRRDGRLLLSLVDAAQPQSSFVQSCLQLDDPGILVLDYMQVALLSLLWAPEPRRVHTVGLGGGDLTRIFHRHFPACHIVASEISPLVARLARRYFGLPDDDRLTVAIQDGRAFLETSQARFDIIIVDVFLDKGTTPPHLLTYEFFDLVRRRLAPAGVAAVNIPRHVPDYPERVRTWQAVFPRRAYCAASASTVMLFGWDGPAANLLALSNRAAGLQARHGFRFPFAEWVPLLRLDHELDALVPGLAKAVVKRDPGEDGD